MYRKSGRSGPASSSVVKRASCLTNLVPSVTRQLAIGQEELRQGKFRSDNGKNVCTDRVVKHWNRLLNIDKGIECKFADETKLSDTLDTPE
ncbi:hypothetical protein TURU_019413 [Turdus rufiventris]|nr:hypothetical protein TURU_019413 [Turdus rufiventris]